MKRVLAQMRKELTQTSRDRLTVALALILPVILLWLLGSAISLDVNSINIVVQDLDRSILSRGYIETLQGSLTYHLVGLSAQSRPDTALASGQARAAVIIPEGFERRLRRGQAAEVQWLIDATDANTANIMRASAPALSQSFLNRIKAVEQQALVKAHIRFWYNPGRRSDQFIGPGMLAMGLALFPPLLAALAMSRESEQKTILQVYVSSISAGEYLLGKVLAFMVVSLLEWALCLLASIILFGIWFAGDPTPFLVCTLLYVFCNVCFGVMVGAVIANQAAAIQATQIVGFLFSFLMSGFIFPVSNIPVGIRWVSNLVPATYYLLIIRDCFLRGGGWGAVWQAPLVLTAIGAFFFTMAWLRMRRMQVD